jgi:hypothetical protein
MAYRIRIGRWRLLEARRVADMLLEALPPTRFVCDVHVDDERTIRLGPVRLFRKKDYCGNHPGPCPLRVGGHRPHLIRNYLEGADWVAFNDLINTLLDRMKVEARVSSTACVVRKGRRRRVRYGQSFIGIATDWTRVGDDVDYEDWYGRRGAPASWYPPGTPGLYSTRREDQREHAG